MHQPGKPLRLSRKTTLLISAISSAVIIGTTLGIAIFAHTRAITYVFTSSNHAISLVPISCTTPPHDPGDSAVSIQSGGLTRTFIVHVPPSYGSQAEPLVILYHAYSFSAEKMEQYSQMNREADARSFIVVYPQGADQPSTWNAGNGAEGPTGDANDIQFTSDMLGYLNHNYCVDAHRVYAAGFSIGGGMVYRLACALTDQFAAIATVSGAYYPIPGGCHPSHPIPILEIHGQADHFAPYNGNPAAMMASVQSYLNGWLSRDGCSNSSQIIFARADVTGLQWNHCAGGTAVTHYRISDGGHTWPDGGTIAALGYSTHTIDANTVIWSFFSQYSL